MKEKTTAWVFLLPTYNKRQNPEPWHIMDLAFGVFKLESAGIPQSNIFIIIDGIDYVKISEIITQFTGAKHKIYSTDEIQDLRSDAVFCTSLVLFIFGHGDEFGLASHKIITPHVLLNAIQESINIKKAIIYLGPCYSGIFNHLKTIGAQDIIFIGSTNFYSSISSRVSEQIANGEKTTWIANFFLLGTFKWFSAPEDIDGDGEYTIMDSFKFISVYSNRIYENIKKSDFPYLIREIPHYHKRLIKLGKRYKMYLNALETCKELRWKKLAEFYQSTLNNMLLEIKTINRKINEYLKIDLFNIQESWISSPEKALSITYSSGEVK
jgi:hypothetical protein